MKAEFSLIGSGREVSRRSIIGTATGIFAAVASRSASASLAPPLSAAGNPPHVGRVRPFVLVHGAWHGGWCWKVVAQSLRRRGHIVYTPTLTGLGERAHPAHDDTDLSTHVRDVLELLRYEDLRDVTLVGHSYSGFVITGVAAQASDLISELVYLDAFVPTDGQSFADLAHITGLRALVRDGLVAPMLSVEQLGIRDPDIARWASDRIGGHPWRCFAQPLRLSSSGTSRLPRRYIRSSDLIPQEADKAAVAKFEMIDIRPAGHDVMLTEPERLADILDTGEGVRAKEED